MVPISRMRMLHGSQGCILVAADNHARLHPPRGRGRRRWRCRWGPARGRWGPARRPPGRSVDGSFTIPNRSKRESAAAPTLAFGGRPRMAFGRRRYRMAVVVTPHSMEEDEHTPLTVHPVGVCETVEITMVHVCKHLSKVCDHPFVRSGDRTDHPFDI